MSTSVETAITARPWTGVVDGSMTESTGASTTPSWTRSTDESTKQSTAASTRPSTDQSTAQSTDPELDRIEEDLRTVRGRTANYRRAVRAFTIAVAIVVLFAMGTAAVEVQTFAKNAGFETASSWALDPVVGLALIVLMLGEALVADAGGKAPRGTSSLRHFAGAVTLTMNCWPSYAAEHWDSVLLHAVMPSLLIGFAAVAPKYRRVLSDLMADLRAQELILIRRRDELDAEQRAAGERRKAAAAQAVLDRVATERAETERLEQAARSRREEESRIRVEEARQLAEIEAHRMAAAAEIEQIRAAAAEAMRRANKQEKTTTPAAKKTAAPATGRPAPPPKATAVSLIAEAMAKHTGDDPYEFDWETWAGQHGGSRSYWLDAKSKVGQPEEIRS